MLIPIQTTKDVKTPVRANMTDAGMDFFVPNDFESVMLKPGESVCIPSGIKMAIPLGYMGLFLNKSSRGKIGLVVGAQVVDHGYTGEIHLDIHNISDKLRPIEAGMKLTQMTIIPVLSVDPTEVDDLNEYSISNRGDGGFGSTGGK